MASEYVRRTAVTRISVDEEQRELLEDTISAWRRGCQIAADLAWETCNADRDVQSLAYDSVREETALGSQHAVLATHQAAEAIRSCLDHRKRGKSVSKPTFTAPTITYDARSMTLFDDGTVSLATTENRVRCALALPEQEDGYQHKFLDSEAWSVTESTLTARDDEFFLHIGFRRHETETERETAENGTVLGVDLGLENLAVTSTAAFINGRAMAHRLREFETVRAGLQQTGTRSAHRTLVGASGRQLRYIRDVAHRAANEIVAEARRFECDVIAFENLTDIRDRTDASWGHKWTFRKVYEYVAYKARSVGISVAQIGPAHTSTRCAECGFNSSENRPARSHFRCCECGVEANADYNAAKNIGLRYVRRGRQSFRRTGDSQLALKSGTVTPDGHFSAYPDGFEAEFTDNPTSR